MRHTVITPTDREALAAATLAHQAADTAALAARDQWISTIRRLRAARVPATVIARDAGVTHQRVHQIAPTVDIPAMA